MANNCNNSSGIVCTFIAAAAPTVPLICVSICFCICHFQFQFRFRFHAAATTTRINGQPNDCTNERTSVRCGTLQVCTIASSLSSSRTSNLNLHCGRLAGKQGARLVALDAICDCNGCTLFLFDRVCFEVAFAIVFFFSTRLSFRNVSLLFKIHFSFLLFFCFHCCTIVLCALSVDHKNRAA